MLIPIHTCAHSLVYTFTRNTNTIEITREREHCVVVYSDQFATRLEETASSCQASRLIRMLRPHMHVEAVFVACHIVAMLALLCRQSAALEAQVTPEIFFVRVGLVATRTGVHTSLGWRLGYMLLLLLLQRGCYLVQRCYRFYR